VDVRTTGPDAIRLPEARSASRLAGLRPAHGARRQRSGRPVI